MFDIGVLNNLDLLSVAIAIAGIGILGFVVFFNNRRSITNRTFLAFSLVTIFWGLVNYLNYQTSLPILVLWLLRLLIFLGVWHAFLFFQLFYVFPQERVTFSKYYKYLLFPLVVLTSLINLSPLVFPSIAELSRTGVSKTVVGPGIYLFVGMAVSLIGGGIYSMIKKYRHAEGIAKKQFEFLLGGAVVMFALLITFNLILPAIFLNVRFIPLGAVFIFPFIAFTAYAIFKHHLLNVKVIAAEILVFILSILTFSEVVIANGILIIIFRSGVFVLTLSFGILLIQSVWREVEQREELERFNEKLESEKSKVEELSRFKTQLLSLASHQIKSPLAAIKGFSSILLQGLYGPLDDKIKAPIEKIRIATNELLSLVDTLLDLRKVEEGKMEYKFEKTDLNALVKHVVDELKILADKNKIGLHYISPESEVFVSADPPKLQQVIQNLIDNSIKYTPHGFVEVELRIDKDYALLSVIDTGLGISKELIPHLFEEFVRDERVKKEIRGTGFGLYIARKIIEAHGGEVWAESDGENKGSRFYMKLKKML